jgi:hypothetical protein
VCGFVWYFGNELLFSEHGIATYYENEIPEDQRPTSDTFEYAWNIWPLIVLIGAAIYVIYAAMHKEPHYQPAYYGQY